MQPKSTLPNAAIYVRVSSRGQQDDGTSLQSQEAACRAYAAERGYRVAGVYSDTHTGSEYRERPALSELRQSIRRRNLDVVICYATDRLSRNQAHLYIIDEEMTDHGARLELVTEDFEDSAVGRFLRSTMAFIGEVEREKIIERTTRGRRERAQAGKLLAGPRPLYGYRWRDADKSALDVDPDTAPVVMRIYDLAAGGTPLRRIAIALSDDAVPTPTGRNHIWRPGAIAEILHHPYYSGNAHAWTHGNGASIPLAAGVVPAIVDGAVWEAVQVRLTRNKAEASRNNAQPDETLLRAGFARCGYCGWAMSVNRTSRGGVNYTCSQGNKHGNTCPAPTIRASILDAAAWDRAETLLRHPDIIADELGRLEADDPTPADVARIERLIADIDRRRANLARSIAGEDDDEAAAPLEAENKALARQRQALEDERAVAEQQQAVWARAREALATIQTWCETVAANLDDLDYEGRRTALLALRVEALVYKADEAERYTVTTRFDLEGGIESGTTTSCGHNTLTLHWSSTDRAA